MIGATLDQPGVASAPDEVLMRRISRRRHDALAELYGRHSKRLRATIDGVVHEEAEAVELAFFNGLSHREIAAATRAPLGTVKTRLELGLQKLTHALRPLRHKV